jgi:S-layer family protein
VSGGFANFISNGFGARACSSNCDFIAPVMLPAGAVILAFEYDACDTDPAGQTTMNLVRQPSLEGPFTVLESVGTGVPSTPGCAFFTATLATPHTVNNNNNTYQLKGFIVGSSLATRFQAVRIVYRLRVSNAPATATFPNDVPTSHPFFQFVEDLAAAGITGGCSAGSYCPNSPITRGEMAVFLASALGLHFPN